MEIRGDKVSNLKFFALNFKGCKESGDINPSKAINCSKLLIIRSLDFISLPIMVTKLSGFMFQFCSKSLNFDFLNCSSNPSSINRKVPFKLALFVVPTCFKPLVKAILSFSHEASISRFSVGLKTLIF